MIWAKDINWQEINIQQSLCSDEQLRFIDVRKVDE
jgi:hypothetical protein